ncbi:unnamed protein product [Phytophthora fragariaefolia]|uniref:Unnamed protein product n=1 Tax=Phytophthora fragariaefolia TaxID=1490495 RepID=A0A9W6X6U5_9STRA|nr:unnamed protein product [Phytophthora fragariaefolia]
MDASAPRPDAAASDLGDYRDAAWFQAGEGELPFAHWLLSRCNGVGDAATPQSAQAARRLLALFRTQRRLRRELALGSRQVADTDETPLWPVEQVVEQVGAALRPSRLALRRREEAGGAFERVVVAEVVDNATELILSRATAEHDALLGRWLELLKEEKDEEKEEKGPEVEEDEEDAEPKSNKKDKKRAKKNSHKTADDAACEQVQSFLTFLDESAQTQTQTRPEATVSAAPDAAEKLWTEELQRIVERSSIEPEEEARRLRVARDIQTVLRREISKWRHCEVVLFGSSLTLYGSRNSDLDMCLLPTGRSPGAQPKQVMGKRQFQQLVDGKAGDNGHEPTTEAEIAELLRDLRAQVQKSIEKLTQALNTLDRSGKNGDKHMKQRQHLQFFDTQMRLLRNAIMAKLTKLNGATEPRNDASGKSAHLKSIIAASRRRSDDLYLLRAILQRAAKCEVRHVIAGARVPIIRFLHTRSGREYECDLCFENVLATRNTPLLRAYASFDDRARALGLAVKHWAKQRGISDASMGFLSSYSFVLLSIYYLQVVHVLPNLQDPRLLESAQIRPDYYNDINIAFCDDRGVARAFHQRTSATGSSDMPLTTLLVGFFEFYATQFDFANRVVTVRTPETVALKIAQWGSRKAKTWRLSIQDPLETGRDLGCVLQFKGQEKIIRELRRAHEMLARGESFLDEVCAVEKPAGKSGKAGTKAKQGAGNESSKRTNEDFSATGADPKPKQQQSDKTKRSYVVTMQSADEELTKEVIESFFKDFHRSFCVGKVSIAKLANDGEDECADENKRWEVELLSQAQNCPRALSLRTRIDWKAADGQVGRVWLHHQALFATPPCQTCLSPEHTTGKCVSAVKEEDVNDERNEHKIPQKNVRRHVLRLTLGGDHSDVSVKKNDHRKKQQHHGSSENTHRNEAKANHKRNNNDKHAVAKKEPRGNKRTEAERVNTVRSVEVVDVVSSSSSRVEDEGTSSTSKTPQKTKKRRQVVRYRKRGSSKGESNIAAAQ